MATASEIKKRLKGYKHADMAASDIATMLTNFRNLRMQDIKLFVHPNGKRENCISICGTIPVTFRGLMYNIPVIFWIHPKHPYEAPVVYVLPTSNMDIQPSQYVDANGRVHMPYLNFWKVSTSDLSALGHVLCSTFATNCPVYSKAASGVTSPRMPLSPQSSLGQLSSSWSANGSSATTPPIITDVAFLHAKEKVPHYYTVIEQTKDGKKAIFSEGRLNRYFCYCKKQVSEKDLQIVSGLMIASTSERAQKGYHPVNNTLDDGAQAFKKKQLLVRYEAAQEAKEAVAEIVLFNKKTHKKEEVPEGFKQLPELSGLHICFKTVDFHFASLSRSRMKLSSSTEDLLKASTSPAPTQSQNLALLQPRRPRSPAPNPPIMSNTEEMKELKEKMAQLRHQLEVANTQIHEMQISSRHSCDHDPPAADDGEYVYADVRYINIQRRFTLGTSDALLQAKRNEVTIVREIGRGASGLVSKGRFRGQEVAVKQIHQEILSQQHVMEEFRREVTIMANIQHPNLVRFIGAVFDESVRNLMATPLLLLELLQKNLRQAYEDSDLGFGVALTIFRDVAYGLHYLHEHQEPIIHRDVSAPNVLLEALPGGTWRAKLSDFGSANFLKRSKTPAMGAIVYTAPEMFPRDDPTAPMPRPTVKCDVFSYGIVLVEVITRSLPSPENRHRLFQELQRKWPQVHDLAIQCTQTSPASRPMMSTVLNTLYRIPTTGHIIL